MGKKNSFKAMINKAIKAAVVITLCLSTFLIACSQSEPNSVDTPLIPKTPEIAEEEITQGDIEDTDEPVESKLLQIYIHNLAFELKHQIINGQLDSFLKEYPNNNEPEHTISLKGTGGYHFVLPISSNNLGEIQQHIENAYYLLEQGRLPNEIQSRQLNKEEVINELQQANVLLVAQSLSVTDYKVDIIQWLEESDDISPAIKEKTSNEYLDICDDYCQRLSKIVSILDRILTDLPMAIEE